MIKSIFLTCLIKYVSLILRYNKQEIVSPYPNCTTIKGKITTNIYSACGSVPKLCSTLCDPMNCSMPGFLVLHYLPEFAQTHVHSVSDAVQPSHPLLPPSLLPLIIPSIKVFSNELVLSIRWPKYWNFNSAQILPMNIQGWFPLGLTGLVSLPSKGLSRVFSNTTVQKHQFFSAQPSSQSNSHICTWPQEKP